MDATQAKIQLQEFTNHHINICEHLKNEVKENLDITPGNNIYLLIKGIQQTIALEGNYVECGTFEGRTLFPLATFYNKISNSIQQLTQGMGRKYLKTIYGMDSFKGFPTSEYHSNDLPERFKDLYKDKLISKDHFEKAKKRTKNFKSLDHLKSNYFEDINDVFEKAKKVQNVELIKGSFSDTTPNFDKKICLLHLDCDLYESYLVCLDNLYKNVVNKGVIIFDEYYSYKYPGARIAVDEFFKDKKGTFEKYIDPEGYERWWFIKEED